MLLFLKNNIANLHIFGYNENAIHILKVKLLRKRYFMIIKLFDYIDKIPGFSAFYLGNRKQAEQLYLKIAEEKLSDYSETNRKVIIDCEGISLATSSFLDELLFIQIFSANCHHGNSILILKNMCEEFYFNLKMSVEGKKKLIEEAKKKNRYFLTLQNYKEYCSVGKSVSNVQIGSPYLLCEYNKRMEVLGFSEGEKQKKLLTNIIENKKRYTASLLAAEEHISNTAAANRLTRLFDRNLLFRQPKVDCIPEIYEYFYI